MHVGFHFSALLCCTPRVDKPMYSNYRWDMYTEALPPVWLCFDLKLCRARKHGKRDIAHTLGDVLKRLGA